MIDFIPYFKYIEDDNNYVHSIDMIYLRGLGYIDFMPLIKKYQIEYEKGFVSKKNKYSERYNYLNFDTVALTECAIVGYTAPNWVYDDLREDWANLGHNLDTVPYFEIRFNPNKICKKEWFSDFVLLITNWQRDYKYLFLHKFDYAVDVPDKKTYEFLIKSRKTSGRFKDTYYWGKTNRNGYFKLYNKTQEINDSNPFNEKIQKTVSRLEYTFVTGNNIRFDDISTLDFTDTDDLKDTDKAILLLYDYAIENGFDVPLKTLLGRGKGEKLDSALYTSHKICDYELLHTLLNEYMSLFHCAMSVDDTEIEIDFDEFYNDLFSN